ncbi:MAG: fused MFS/spermidine synthase [Acidobacteriia bacterium]|nr:fused MFS/spermidine synthase [Terriglobia bacterium]
MSATTGERTDRDGARPALAWSYGTAIALGAFLLFEVQPLIARYILPWFGGSIEVWTTCMLFFQVMLLLGYLYAHVSTRFLPPRGQAALHGAVLLAAMAFLPVIPADRWRPSTVDVPSLRILLLLLATTGLPFFALSATSPLLQSWISTLRPKRNVYRLYALSNAGSLLALMTYPFLVEPYLARRAQSWAWSAGLIAFAVTCAICAFPVWAIGRLPGEPAPPDSPKRYHGQPATIARGRAPRSGKREGHAATDAPTDGGRRALIYWLLLPAAASMMLLASTNMLCLEVASFPFLWVLPLTLYLLTFILCFAGERWYPRRVMFGMAVVAGLGVVALRYNWLHTVSMAFQVVVYMAAMFACCMICHGETYRLRPPAERLTAFYLLISSGGALGGFMVAIVAPLLFRGYWEFYLAMPLCVALAIDAMQPMGERRARRWRFARTLGEAAIVCAGALLVVVDRRVDASGRTLERARNFYGVLRVMEKDLPLRPDRPELEFTLRELQNGPITHGSQIYDVRVHEELARSPRGTDRPLKVPSATIVRAAPTTYYGPDSGGGVAMRFHPDGTNRPRRIAIVGLGAGTLAAYGRPGDTIRYYEINPEVAAVADSYFTFLSDCRQRGVHLDVVLGDGRLSLQREPANGLDILVVDAFTGDAIPVHLLTREAFALYFNCLRREGVLAVHVSNRHLSLAEEVGRLARAFDVPEVLLRHRPDKRQLALTPSEWVLLSRNRLLLDDPLIRPHVVGSPVGIDVGGPPWTDDFSSLLGALRW